MKKQIVRISPYQTAKVAAGMYFLLSLPAVLILAAALPLLPSGTTGLPMLLVAAGLYVLCAFLATALSAWLYNVVAAHLGGFEFTTEEIDKPAAAS